MILGLGGSSSKVLPCPDPLATGLGDLVPETTRLEWADAKGFNQ